MLGRGLLGLYLSVLVLLPVAALLAQSTKGGTAAFWREVSNPQALAAIKLTLAISAIVVLINAIFGTLIAWVLVRDEFPGKRIVNALIDLPFALPTIVIGLVLLALYGNGSPLGIDVAFTRASIALALLFVTLPFVVRSVQPVLIELDRSMEEAAASLGAGPATVLRRIVLPALTPAIVSGVALSFARAVGEFGSLVLITGNLPFKTEVGSVYIFGQIQDENLPAAAAVSVVLLRRRCSCWARWRWCRDGGRSMSFSKLAARTIALGYLTLLLAAPVVMIFYRTFEHGLAPVWNAINEPNAVHAFWLSIEIVAIAVPLNTAFGVGMALLLERGKFKGKVAAGDADRPAVRDLAGRRRAGARARVRENRLVRELADRARHPDHLLRAGHGDRDRGRVAAVRRARDRAGAARAGNRRRAGRGDARRERLADVLADHAARDPLGGRLRRRADDRPRARRVRRGQRRLRADRGPDADAAAVRAGPLRELQHHRRLHRRGRARAAGAGYPRS